MAYLLLIWPFSPNPAQCLLPVGECPHRHRFSATKCIDIGEIHLLPLTAILGTHSGVNKHHDPVARGDELDWLADNFCPGGP
jgi:hypothetical protein